MSLSNDFEEIPKLFGDAIEQLGKLMQNEAQLARTEMSQKLAQASIGAGYLAGAMALFIPVSVILLMALASWLVSMGIQPTTSYLCSALAGAVASGILAMVGLSRLKPENITPTVTLTQVKRDVETAKELAR